jgi:photosystem II stability/assembly factor-like uncharacterized protein
MKRLPLFFLGSLLAIVVCCGTGVAQNITWTVQQLPDTDLMWEVKAVDLSVAWAVGNHGNIFRTTNGGTTWTSVGYSLDHRGGSTWSIEAISATTAFVCGANHDGMSGSVPSNDTSFVWRTTDGGGTWSVVFAQSHGFVDAVRMISPTEGIGVGDPVKGEGRWTIIRTTDSGTTWSRIPTEPLQMNGELGLNRSLCTYGTNHIWFGTVYGNNSSAAVYRSTDAGLTWSRASTPLPYYSWTVWFSDSLHGLCSDTCLARSTDGGVTWLPIGLPGWDWYSYDKSWLAFASVSGGKDLWATLDTTIYRSTDWGASWSIAYHNTKDTLLYGSFANVGDSTVGWFTTLGAKIVACKVSPVAAPVLVSPPNGATSQSTTLSLVWRKSIGALTYRVQVASDSGFTMILSDDSTVTDTTKLVGSLAPYTNYYWRVKARHSGGSSLYSTMWTFTCPVSIQEVDGIPTHYSLGQNYPNPFNPSTTIRYELPHASRASLKVYNTLGQEVATLVNETKAAGVYTVTFDAVGLASDVYFYRLQAGSFVDTKKLLLVR